MQNEPDFVLSIYLRGGADGLSFLPPYEESPYIDARPTLKFLAPPTVPNQTPAPNQALPLTDADPTTSPPTPAFDLAPALEPLLSHYGAQHLAFVHATGSTVDTRSHFDQQAHTEVGSGTGTVLTDPSGIWSRYLQYAPPVGGGIRALAIQTKLPDLLRNAPETAAVADPPSFGFPGAALTANVRRTALTDLYTLQGGELQTSFENALATIDELEQVQFDTYVPSNGAVYPTSPLGVALRQAAQLAKELPVEIVHVDSGGWDTHFEEGPFDGTLHGKMSDLAQCLAAFGTDMIPGSRNVVVLVMTEFGRTLTENSSFGTDHGRGGVAIVLGQGVQGGQVYTRWPGLGPSELSGGDLDVKVDLRDVIAELAHKRLGVPEGDLHHLFADDGFVHAFLGMFA